MKQFQKFNQYELSGIEIYVDHLSCTKYRVYCALTKQEDQIFNTLLYSSSVISRVRQIHRELLFFSAQYDILVQTIQIGGVGAVAAAASTALADSAQHRPTEVQSRRQIRPIIIPTSTATSTTIAGVLIVVVIIRAGFSVGCLQVDVVAATAVG